MLGLPPQQPHGLAASLASSPLVPMSSPKSAPLWRTCDLALRPHVAYPLCLTSPGPGALSLQILCSQDSLSGGASLSMAPLSLPDAESTPGVRRPGNCGRGCSFPTHCCSVLLGWWGGALRNSSSRLLTSGGSGVCRDPDSSIWYYCFGVKLFLCLCKAAFLQSCDHAAYDTGGSLPTVTGIFSHH